VDDQLLQQPCEKRNHTIQRHWKTVNGGDRRLVDSIMSCISCIVYWKISSIEPWLIFAINHASRWTTRSSCQCWIFTTSKGEREDPSWTSVDGTTATLIGEKLNVPTWYPLATPLMWCHGNNLSSGSRSAAGRKRMVSEDNVFALEFSSVAKSLKALVDAYAANIVLWMKPRLRLSNLRLKTRLLKEGINCLIIM